MACDFVFTNPFPAEHEMPKYYQSKEYISHSNTDYSIKELPYHLARKYMLRRKLNWIRDINSSTGRLLDFGCGAGSFLSFMLANNWDVWGIEPNQNALEIANQKSGNHAFSELSLLPVTQFDFITLWHVLEHVYPLHKTTQSILSYLKTNGHLIIAVPNCASYDAGYYQENWAAYDVPRHHFHFTPETMNLFAKKHRLQLIQTIPLKLDALYIGMLSEKYAGGSVFNGLYQGFKSNHLANKHQKNHSSLVYILKK
jgi:2-polyprenyl-3-methyl-5-hydroxy-6-metoxy-1,4-benzoquinol methylase